MNRGEMLELKFYAHPRPAIHVRIITPAGQETMREAFEDDDCAASWIGALQEMAATLRHGTHDDYGSLDNMIDDHMVDDSTADTAPSNPSPTPARYLPGNNITNDFGLFDQYPYNSPSYHRHSLAPFTPQNLPGSDLLDGDSRLSSAEPPSNVLDLDTSTLQQQLYLSPKDHVFQETVAHVYFPGPESLVSPSPSYRAVMHGSTAGSPTRRRVHTRSNSSTANMALETTNVLATAELESLSSKSPSRRSSSAGDNPNLSVTSCSTPSRDIASQERNKRLEVLLAKLRDHAIPDRQEHNEKVQRLYNDQESRAEGGPISFEQFGQLLGRLGDVCNTIGVLYSLLSWEIFRWEEERLVTSENVSELAAAKRVGLRIGHLPKARLLIPDD
jgi:hypothetical protein